MLGALLLAAVVQGGQIPVWDAVKRFPDASYWPGTGQQRTSNMLYEIRRDVGSHMRWAGPGPQQLAARWVRGGLTSDEQVALLLGGADFHHPSLLPVYAQALAADDHRVRQAALIGLHWLLGEPAPDAIGLPAESPVWQQAARMAEALAVVTRYRTLVEVWVDSYLAAENLPYWGRFVFHRSGPECLAALREIATPADLNALVVLWPFLVSDNERYALMRTIEMVSLQKFLEIAKSPRGGWGDVFYRASAGRVDQWVGSRCSWVDGNALVMQKVVELGEENGLGMVGGWLAAARAGYPPVWPTVAEALVAQGAPAVWLNRQQFEDPRNEEAMRRVREHFPLTGERLGAASQARGGPQPVR